MIRHLAALGAVASFAARVAAETFLQPPRYCHGCIDVPTYFHVITEDDGTGAITDEDIDQQMQILNEAFEASPFYFDLVGTSVVANSTVSHDLVNIALLPAYRDTYDELYVPGRNVLNVFWGAEIVRLNPDLENSGPLGASFTAQLVGLLPSLRPKDAVLMQTGARAGGTILFPGYDEPTPSLGKALIHEVGHWLGLNHIHFDGPTPSEGFLSGIFDNETLQVACSFRNGDYVEDTPAAVTPLYSLCLAGQDPVNPRDTCPNQPGVDLYDNFMDTSEEPCMERFTPGQFSRKFQQWIVFRRPVEGCRTDVVTIDLSFGPRPETVNMTLFDKRGVTLFSSINNGARVWSRIASFSEPSIEICLPKRLKGNDELTLIVSQDPDDDMPAFYEVSLNGELVAIEDGTNPYVEIFISDVSCHIPCPEDESRFLVCQENQVERCVKGSQLKGWLKKKSKKAKGRGGTCGPCDSIRQLGSRLYRNHDKRPRGDHPFDAAHDYKQLMEFD